MANTVPMLAPDGTSGDIPQERMQDALKAGFKQAVVMTSPDGKQGYVPVERQQDALTAGFKLAQPSLDLSNKQGQGTYQMTGPDGKAVGVPYGQVQQAAEGGYGFASDQDKFRYAKDNAADPKRVTKFSPAAGDPRASLDYQQQMEQNLPAPMQVVAGVAKGGGTLMRPVADVVGKVTGASPDDVSTMLRANGGIQTAAKVATMGAALAPAAITAPVATAGALAGGTVGAGAGQLIGDASGMKPENTQLLSDALGLAGGAGGGVGGSKLSSSVIPTIKSYLRPPVSPSVVARSEMAARNLSAAVLPASKDASSFIRAAQEEVPNVLDYAKRTGNPLNTQLEFSKAAQGYAQDVRGLYEKEVLGPVADKSVETTGSGFGTQMRQGEGPNIRTFATLRDIDERVVALNKQLDAPAINSDDSRRALASKTELQSEVRQLKTILHNNLSEASGLTPDEVANLRQRVGRSYELANDTDAAVTQRMQAVGKGELKDVSFHQLPGKAYNFARGGPVSIADRAFQRAISAFPGQASPLPAVQAPATPPVVPDRLEQLLSLARRQQNVNRWNSEKF